jgi:hypothetical protein
MRDHRASRRVHFADPAILIVADHPAVRGADGFRPTVGKPRNLRLPAPARLSTTLTAELLAGVLAAGLSATLTALLLAGDLSAGLSAALTAELAGVLAAGLSTALTALLLAGILSAGLSTTLTALLAGV